MSIFSIVLITIASIALIILVNSVRLVRQSTAVVVERLGKYNKTLQTGLHLIIPFFDRANAPISLKEKSCRFSTTTSYYKR